MFEYLEIKILSLKCTTSDRQMYPRLGNPDIKRLPDYHFNRMGLERLCCKVLLRCGVGFI